jgi:hypothetical protein
MFNPNQVIQSAKAKAMQLLRDNAKQVVQVEKSGWTKAAQEQGLPVSEKPFEAPKFDLLPPIKEVTTPEEQQIEAESQAKLARAKADLEAEMARWRSVRTQTDQQWVKSQEQLMHPEAMQGAQPAHKPIIETSKPKGPSGVQAATQAKKGSKEMGKQKST